VQCFLGRAFNFFYHQTGDPAASRHLSLDMLATLRERQASSLAYFDVFWASAVLALVLLLPVLLMRRSVAEKGAHIAAD
jgi:DHA2 family multidrug resistance protein